MRISRMERVDGGWALVSAVMMLGILMVATEPEAARRRCALPSFREAVSSARALVGAGLVDVDGVDSAMAKKGDRWCKAIICVALRDSELQERRFRYGTSVRL